MPGLPLLCFRSVQFLKTNVLQYSAVTPFRCGGISNDLFIANFLLSASVKECKKSVSMNKSLVSCFLTHSVELLVYWLQSCLQA